ncbi:hypothetical protein C8R43DRAFT_864847, partial [Mycena crocata]
SDHLPIHYKLSFDVTRSRSLKFNTAKMDIDIFLGILREQLGIQPVPIITTQEELDNAAQLLCDVLAAALEKSTPRHRPSSMAKRWWTPPLTKLRSLMRRKRRDYQKY